MKLLITGASGFLGKFVVAAALQRNHQIKAIVRPASDEKRVNWHNHPDVELIRLDLRQPRGLTEALEGVDAVIHLIATKAGDFYTQFAGTVICTENLLSALVESDVSRLIAVSTFSVYDYLALNQNDLLDENAPIENHPLRRDEYAQTKLIQEELFRDFEREQAGKVTIIRPGMIYGQDNLWNAYLGAELGENRWLRIGSDAVMPLTYVENCAEAIVLAAEKDTAIGQTINIVDDDLPTQLTYCDKLIQNKASTAPNLSVSWPLMQAMAWSFWTFNQKVFGGKAKLPGILIPAKLHPRFKPLRFSNSRAKQLLGWEPKYSLDMAISRSLSA